MLERLIQGEGEFIFTWQSVRHHRLTYRPGEQWIHTFSSSFIMLTMILNSRWHHARDASLPICISQCTPSTSNESSWSSIPNGRRFDTARSSQPSLLTIMQSLAFYMLPFTSCRHVPAPLGIIKYISHEHKRQDYSFLVSRGDTVCRAKQAWHLHVYLSSLLSRISLHTQANSLRIHIHKSLVIWDREK